MEVGIGGTYDSTNIIRLMEIFYNMFYNNNNSYIMLKRIVELFVINRFI